MHIFVSLYVRARLRALVYACEYVRTCVCVHVCVCITCRCICWSERKTCGAFHWRLVIFRLTYMTVPVDSADWSVPQVVSMLGRVKPRSCHACLVGYDSYDCHWCLCYHEWRMKGLKQAITFIWRLHSKHFCFWLSSILDWFCVRFP